MIESRDSEWIHHSMNVLFGLFWRYGLADNVAKSRTIMCQPSTKVGDVIGVQGSVVHRGGIFLPCETLATDLLTGMRS